MLTPRLKLISEYVQGNSVADIGTDHAYIPIELIKKQKCSKVIATDINSGPAEIARKNIKAENLDIEVRIGGGLSVIGPGEVDDIIIAGMGGIMICDIINCHMNTAKQSRLILQPMNRQSELRKFLLDNGFVISSEDLALEGFKVYNVIVCDPTEKALEYKTELDYHIPWFLMEHIYYKHLKAKKIREFTKIISGYEKSRNFIDEDKLHLYKHLIKQIEQRDELS